MREHRGSDRGGETGKSLEFSAICANNAVTNHGPMPIRYVLYGVG